ncbi:MAG: pyruvate, phosphate dikinase, partial [Bryobacterales bacterium]|nr:pyruvate, phosphate dikinase [Bryobacterales bacterium]
FDSLFDAAKELAGTESDAKVPVELLRYLCDSYQQIVERHTGKPFPQKPADQLRGAIEAVFRSWNGPRAIAYREREHIAHDLGTAVNVQAMVFGNRDDNSGTGVGFTRDPATGAKGAYGDFLVNAQGEDVVAGIRNTEPISELKKKFPKVHAELSKIFSRLETHYADMCDTEFTIEQGKLWMLQTRVGKRTGAAALKMAVDMVRPSDLGITRAEAVSRITEDHLDSVLHPQFAGSGYSVWAKGLGASPGAAVGRAVFTAEEAVEMSKGGPVILVRKETTPDDIHGMDVAKGILTAVGGKSSHAAVVARGMGRPCIVGAGSISIDERGQKFTVKSRVVKQGDWISIDGTTGAVYAGQVPTIEPDPHSGHFGKFMQWADEFRGTFGVRANADIPRDAKAARLFGAEGIGLCRTEHMFFAADRIPHMQAMILAREEKDRRKALQKLLPMQRKDFAGLFEAMDGFPVVIRTLDPPLHEFLPKREELMVDIARFPHLGGGGKKELAEKYNMKAGDLKKGLPELLKRVEELHEFNPMLGHRGCRLGITYPEITEMQARAIFEAAVQVAKKGKKVIPEVMIPLVGSEGELENQKAIVTRVAKEVLDKEKMNDLHYLVGTMIEIPRAALLADQIAQQAEFFSFGTNDLTQTTMGLSRDDYTKFSGEYQNLKIFKADPFQSIDQEGVGKLIETAIKLGRGVRNDLDIGICGEHGGDPSSVEYCYRVGMNYVSCSPYRVPIARLAAAQAAIAGADKSESMRTA